MIESICAVSCGLVVYHHAVYPALLKGLARLMPTRPALPEFDNAQAPRVALVIPAFNEARGIAAKIRDCARLDYPEGRLRVVIACDGCTDETAAIAAATIGELDPMKLKFELMVFAANRGKAAVLDDVIERRGEALVTLTDVSARLPTDGLKRAARHFHDFEVGFVTGRYEPNTRQPGQAAYWRYQTSIKSAEAALGSPIGAHGAFYVFRRACWRPLGGNVINDDVVLPMRIVMHGYAGVYDRAIRIDEAEPDTPRDDLRRRRRLAAGAVQQALLLWRLADPLRPGVAFSFLSGKALRAFMPFIMLTALVSNAALAASSDIWRMALLAQLAAYLVAMIGLVSARAAKLPFVSGLSYLVAGHANGLAGAVQYMFGRYSKPWARVAAATQIEEDVYLPRGALAGKRALDIVVGLGALGALAVLFVPIALAIKLESRGPIFYRQLRVGLRTSTSSRLFYLTKFRTMRADAEAGSGAVWATERDPRVTRVGYFLRRTRLDELPQAIDVLRGEMSIVGPRPERPQFFNKLEAEIPFYTERTWGLKPGVTGLAQITLPYDSSIEDVRAKVLHDHAYALQLSAPGGWLLTDLKIIIRTFTVMITGKGSR